MIGKVIMDVSSAEIAAAVEYYFNSDLFFTKHHCKIVGVRQRKNGRFVI